MPGRMIGVWSGVCQVVLAVRGNRLDDFKECWRNCQHGFSVLSGLGVRWTGSRGHCTGPIVLWVIGISQDYLKGVMECNSIPPSRILP